MCKLILDFFTKRKTDSSPAGNYRNSAEQSSDDGASDSESCNDSPTVCGNDTTSGSDGNSVIVLRNEEWLRVHYSGSTENDEPCGTCHRFVIQEIPFSTKPMSGIACAGTRKLDVYCFQESYRRCWCFDEVAVSRGASSGPNGRHAAFDVLAPVDFETDSHQNHLYRSFLKHWLQNPAARESAGGTRSLALRTARWERKYESYLPATLIDDKYFALQLIARARYWEVAGLFHNLPEKWKNDPDVAFFTFLRRGKTNIDWIKNELNSPVKDSVLRQHPFFHYERLFDDYEKPSNEDLFDYLKEKLEKTDNGVFSPTEKAAIQKEIDLQDESYFKVRQDASAFLSLREAVGRDSQRFMNLAKLALMTGVDFGERYEMGHSRRTSVLQQGMELPIQCTRSAGVKNLPAELRHNKELILLAVACEVPGFCREAAKKKQYEKDVVLEAIRIQGGGREIMSEINEELQNDVDVICAALDGGDVFDRWGEDVLRYVSKDTLSNKEQVFIPLHSIHSNSADVFS